MDLASEIRDGDRPLVLYGAGNAGLTVARHLTARNVKIAAFLDARAGTGDMRAGIPVHRLADWANAGRAAGTDVLVTIHNPLVDVAPIIDDLRAAGFSRVMSMVDYMDLFPDDTENRLWLVPSTFYVGKEKEIASTRALLADSLSRRWFDAILRLRREGDYHGLPEPEPKQYHPTSLRRWPEPMRLIDCGAFDGDTLDALVGDGYRMEAVAAFEPDPDNFTKLAAKRFDRMDTIFLPCGVSSLTSMVRFIAGAGVNSRIDGTGDFAIQCVAIDEALPTFAPTLIKMDIEGAEPAALRGAERTLRQHRPALAIAVYHEPNHLWDIPLWLAELDLGYRFYIRGHGYCSYDVILYARAD